MMYNFDSHIFPSFQVNRKSNLTIRAKANKLWLLVIAFLQLVSI